MNFICNLTRISCRSSWCILTCCLSQTGAIFVLLAISKPCIWFRRSLYRFQPKSSPLSSGTLGFPSWGQVQSYLVVHHAMFMCWLFTMLFAPFPVLLLRVSSDNVTFVRTHSSTSVWLLHGLVLLPCGISSKMIIPSKSLLSLLARCSLFCYAYAAIPTTCLSCHPYCWTKPLTHLCPSKPLFGYVTALLSPSYSVVSCMWRWSFFHVGTWIFVGISQYLLFN